MHRLPKVNVELAHMIAFTDALSASTAAANLTGQGFTCFVLPPEVEDASLHGGYYSDEWIVSATRRYVAPDLLNVEVGRADEESAVLTITDPLNGRYDGAAMSLHGEVRDGTEMRLLPPV
jgi:hypothetical protein